MNETIRKTFLGGLAFGVPLPAIWYFMGVRLTTVLTVGSVLFATGMFVGWFSARAERRRREKGFLTDDLEPGQIRFVDYPGPSREAMAEAKRALATVRRLKEVKEIPSPMALRAKTGVTLESFGESILLKFTPTTLGTRIEISSKPRVWGAQGDWGKGIENVESVVKHLVKRGGHRRVV